MNASGVGGNHEPTFVCSSLVKGKNNMAVPWGVTFGGGGGEGGGEKDEVDRESTSFGVLHK